VTDDIKSKNITWHELEVSTEDRERLEGHKGCVIWLTGLSGSGKSTIALALDKALYQAGARSFVLDGDNIRHGLNKDLGFSPEDREENIRRIGEVANLFAQAGVIAITAFISPYRADRRKARASAKEGRFIEVYVDCSVDVCEKRDPKGLYKKARAGQIANFTGVSAPYEAPLKPEINVKTAEATVEECTLPILDFLKEHGIIK